MAYAPADDSQFPDFLGATWERAHTLRYGENPHQPAALYVSGTGGLAEAEQLHGKEMSYNNYTDTDAARRAAYDHSEPAVAIIKHANPCGIAIGADVAEAHRKAHACDPLSAFGGVIAVNRPVSKEMAEQVAEIRHDAREQFRGGEPGDVGLAHSAGENRECHMAVGRTPREQRGREKHAEHVAPFECRHQGPETVERVLHLVALEAEEQ